MSRYSKNVAINIVDGSKLSRFYCKEKKYGDIGTIYVQYITYEIKLIYQLMKISIIYRSYIDNHTYNGDISKKLDLDRKKNH